MGIDCARENEKLKDTEVLKRLEEETKTAELAQERGLAFIELCREGSLEQIADAINNGADVNAQDEAEKTPLMLAAVDNSKLELLRALINAGADVHMRDGNGATPLMFAAGANSNPEVIKTLVNAGADVNASDNIGYTPLMLAAFSTTNPEVIEVLLELGANPKIKNKRDKNAVEYAAGNKYLKGALYEDVTKVTK
jgi:ankyrin repeat protein